MNYANQYEEHLASQPDNSRWDGFDRGADFEVDQGERVVIVEQYCDDMRNYEVHIDGRCVFGDCEDRARAVRVARWWMDGCPA